MNPLSWKEAAGYVLDLPLHTTKNPFAVTKAFYEWLGEPGKKSKIIHVAGTNGKGSTCAYIESVLRTAGYRVGMFTSPHLVDLRERFRLNGEMMGQETFARLTTKLLQLLEQYENGSYRPTFFETLFFIYMLWMEEEKPDLCLVECGMGGRNDVTNVISQPAVTVIARIGLDHTGFLGDTCEQIAWEKAGIMKPGAPAVCLETDEAVKEVFVKEAQKVSAPLVTVSKKEITFSKFTKNTVAFYTKSAYDKDNVMEITLSTTARYQAENALLALRTLEAVSGTVPLTGQQIQAGMSDMRWQARMEEVLPRVFVDGAHNPDGVRALLESAAQDGCTGTRFLLFGASADKSVEEMVGMMKDSHLFSKVTGTVIHNKRSLAKQDFAGLFSEEIPVYEDAVSAFQDVLAQKTENDCVYVAGSLYLAGEIKGYLK